LIKALAVYTEYKDPLETGLRGEVISESKSLEKLPKIIKSFVSRFNILLFISLPVK